MTGKQLKLIYEYMGWCSNHKDEYCPDCGYEHTDRDDIKLDSNLAWEVVQEMERKGDWVGNHKSFLNYVFDDAFPPDDFDNIMMSGESFLIMFNKLQNPTNFFNCMAKWLEDKENI